MIPARKQALETLIGSATGSRGVEISATRACSGGCIHHADILELTDGRKFFVKSSPRAEDMFAQEAQGLAALAAANTLRVPAVVTVGSLEADSACLILEVIESGPASASFWSQFGGGFAELHRTATAASYGWSCDNYLGSSLQRNGPHEDWVEFFAEQRLRYQLRLARQRGAGSRELFKLTERLIERLDKLVGASPSLPSLLHGDLWSGNFLADERGSPVVFDPAVYYGHREADLAMPMLFGGFPAEFFEAYQQAWPLEAGWRQRVEIYQLYHLLNHLNLFGSGYLDSCLEIARRYG